MPNFFERFRSATLDDIFRDQTPVGLRAEEFAWLEPPPEDFLNYARRTPHRAFDGIPEDEKRFRREPTFLISQVHRIWQTISAAQQHLDLRRKSVLYDLGAHPFTVSLALRHYLGFDGRLVDTVNDRVPDEWREELSRSGIELGMLNLDPMVRANDPAVPLPDRINEPDGSVDAIILSHVIEHLYHPMPMLRDVARALKPTGRFLVTTDNAFLFDAFLNYILANGFLHDRVEDTSAMIFHAWRGHVRYFSMLDLCTMLEAAGLRVVEKRFHEVIYDTFIDEYFNDPMNHWPKWKLDLLGEFPEYRNELLLVAEKP